MRAVVLAVFGAGLLAVGTVTALGADGEVSVARGLQVSIVGGCHDCHTVGYNETNGMIDPNTALKGSPVGFQGPWGTTYPKNIRLLVASVTEDQFVTFAKSFKRLPPMPWYNVHAMDESDLRSLYQYVSSLGAPGDAPPQPLPPGVTPQTPYVVMAPPIVP